MSGTTDEIKGRVKEGAGVLTGNEGVKPKDAWTKPLVR